MKRRRLAAAAASVAASLVLLSACHGSSGASSATAAPDGEGGKGSPGPPPPIGPGGDTAWLYTVTGAFADLANGVAADARGITVALAQGDASAPSQDALTVLRLDAAGNPLASHRFEATCGVAGTLLGAAPDGTAYLLAATPCSAAVVGLSAGSLPPGGTLLAVDPAAGAGIAVPTGAVLAGAVDAQGRAALLSSSGEVEVLAADGQPAWRVALDGARLLAALPAGGVVVGTASASGSAPCLVALGDDGAPRWSRELPAGLALHHLAALTDGAVAASGVLSGEASFAAGLAGAQGEQRQVVLAVEPDGSPRALVEVADAEASTPTVKLAPLPHGRVLLYGFAGCDRLRGLSPQLAPVWARKLDDACAATALAAALTPGGAVVVVGAFRGRADFGAGQVATAVDQDGFVLGLLP